MNRVVVNIVRGGIFGCRVTRCGVRKRDSRRAGVRRPVALVDDEERTFGRTQHCDVPAGRPGPSHESIVSPGWCESRGSQGLVREQQEECGILTSPAPDREADDVEIGAIRRQPRGRFRGQQSGRAIVRVTHGCQGCSNVG